MPFVFFAAFKVWHLFVFFSDLHGRLDLELLRKLLYLSTVSTTSVCLCGFASAFYRRCSLPTFCAYQRTTAFPKHIVVFHPLDFTSPYATGDNMESPRGIYLRFSRGITSLLVVVGLSLPLAQFPFFVRPFLILSVLLPATGVAAL